MPVVLQLVESAPPRLDPRLLPGVEVEGLYVHIPFCFHKCHYCDFYSITRQGGERMGRYVDRLLAEAEMWDALPPVVRPRTVFFGGGTPSLLPLEEMRRLLRGLRERFDFSRLEEWTVEANPATVSLEYCAMLREERVDRLSFGAQSFNVAELKMLERHHDPEDVPRSVETARAAGFERINVDLIYAIPGQDLESWNQSLERAMALRTEHLSCYNLTYEPNTPMAVKRRLGHFTPVDEETELAMLHHTRRRLREAGMQAYEISNYAAAGEECRHNLVYWRGGSYAALGASGASHVEGWRWKNRPHLGEWERAIDSGELPAGEVEHLAPRQRAGELAMLGLRLREGLRFESLRERTGVDGRAAYGSVIDPLVKAGLLEEDDDAVRLTEPGISVADAIGGEFLKGEG